MKKVALSLLALSLVSFSAFAEDAAPAPTLKFSGYFNTGIDLDRADDGVITVKADANDWNDGKSVAFRLVGNYTADGFGFKFRLQQTGWSSTTNLLGFNYAYGWVKPFEGVTIDAGYIGDSTFYMVDFAGDAAIKGKGASVYYTNSGFTVGAGAFATDASTWANAGFGAKYSNDAFTAVAVLTTAADKLSIFEASASLAAVPSLTLDAGYYIEGLNTETASDSADFINGEAEYAFTDAFSAGVNGYYYVTDAGADFTPYVSYALGGGFKAGAEVELIPVDYGTTVATQVPALSLAFEKGTSTTTVWAGYDVAAKTFKSYFDFLLTF